MMEMKMCLIQKTNIENEIAAEEEREACLSDAESDDYEEAVAVYPKNKNRIY